MGNFVHEDGGIESFLTSLENILFLYNKNNNKHKINRL